MFKEFQALYITPGWNGILVFFKISLQGLRLKLLKEAFFM